MSFWLNCCERKTLFRLKREAEQAEYGVSRTGPLYVLFGSPLKFFNLAFIETIWLIFFVLFGFPSKSSNLASIKII